LREAVQTLHSELRITVVYVTHDQNEAAALGDAIAIMNVGALQQAGAAAELYRDPANSFVAEFFGPERPNIFPCHIRDGRVHPEGADGSFPAPVSGAYPAICILRPEAIKPGEPGRGFDGRIRHVRHTGWNTSAVIDLSGFALRATLPFRPDLPPGALLSFTIEPGGIFLFEPASGRRLRG
jgi:ABC-type sugar transport system ATPase subunit